MDLIEFSFQEVEEFRLKEHLLAFTVFDQLQPMIFFAHLILSIIKSIIKYLFPFIDFFVIVFDFLIHILFSVLFLASITVVYFHR